MQKTLTKKRIAYLMVTMLFALIISTTSTYAWSIIEWNWLTGGSATAIIVVLSVFGAVIIYAKFFRGSATKLFSKLKRK